MCRVISGRNKIAANAVTRLVTMRYEMQAGLAG